MSLQKYYVHQKKEPHWFSKVRETFGVLIYDTKIEVLGIDTCRKFLVNYDSSGILNRTILDSYQKSFIKWRE